MCGGGGGGGAVSMFILYLVRKLIFLFLFFVKTLKVASAGERPFTPRPDYRKQILYKGIPNSLMFYTGL